MLVNAEERFAARAAGWMMKDKNLKGAELVKRLALFPDSFAVMISKESMKIRKQQAS